MQLRRRHDASTIDQVRASLWTDVDPASYAAEGEHYRAAVLEQYRVYVDMADRISARRSASNTFFLSLNTLVLATLGTVWQGRNAPHAWQLTLLLVPLLAQCFTWFWLVRSYRQINAAKYVVIGALEERLPASPYWRAEWRALGDGRAQPRYWPLTQLEQIVPVVFAVTYMAAFVLVLSS